MRTFVSCFQYFAVLVQKDILLQRSNNIFFVLNKPSIASALLYRTATEMCYQAIALRDIAAGEEVTCDYALFDYQCNGHQIEVCACGSQKCRGQMLGFQGTPCRS
jgi:hypothetical protein